MAGVLRPLMKLRNPNPVTYGTSWAEQGNVSPLPGPFYTIQCPIPSRRGPRSGLPRMRAAHCPRGHTRRRGHPQQVSRARRPRAPPCRSRPPQSRPPSENAGRAHTRTQNWESQDTFVQSIHLWSTRPPPRKDLKAERLSRGGGPGKEGGGRGRVR